MNVFERFLGSIIGGAAGDALGYEIKFVDEAFIDRVYGASGLVEFVTHNGVAQISDDTQMTMFTITGLLRGAAKGKTPDMREKYYFHVALSYQDWLKTQLLFAPDSEKRYSWLANVKELYRRRAPGNTCISALKSGYIGTMEEPLNDSCGCGGVMRVAPVGLMLSQMEDVSLSEIAKMGAKVAAITHGNDRGYISAAVVSCLIAYILRNPDEPLIEGITYVKHLIEELFSQSPNLDDVIYLIESAIALSKKNIPSLDAIHELGEGWVGDEAMAIALYCSLKYENDFEKAMIASVNHKGDSDSTGAITGNILGAYLGFSAIPDKFVKTLEHKDILTELSRDLLTCRVIMNDGSDIDALWKEKYLTATYKKA